MTTDNYQVMAARFHVDRHALRQAVMALEADALLCVAMGDTP